MRDNRLLILPAACVVTALLFAANLLAQSETKTEAVIQPGSVVSFDYTLKDESGVVLDSSKGKGPMSYTHGKGQIIPGLESQLSGMKIGGEKHVSIKPEDGYGPVDPAAFQEVPKEKLPAGALKVGTMLTAQGPQGRGVPVRVHEIKEKTVIMDFNHPLAGKTLSFDIKITDIKAAK